MSTPTPIADIVTDAIDGYKAGLDGAPLGFVSEAFDRGWSRGQAEKAERAAELSDKRILTKETP